MRKLLTAPDNSATEEMRIRNPKCQLSPTPGWMSAFADFIRYVGVRRLCPATD